ncbi:PepSY-associated TM helix domain-containing protein [Rhodopirellula sp. MGV]|uniref:PepSY-associated TM helix domain-containing protein n=1 Tax=Rhodopirellula sp. MGV TaxID=2023130 RepID=UPI000B96DB0D|nr:PepSY-associated TM helix domain-containing protein [Rhodopirellula sp. MGV]OYP31058.1 hypothetical protein CGZ80_22070 [Rhodopirellula sp. MGV]PNY38232.1 PepSY domain-containing protein [Rhodopirellula baltica]
MSKFRKRQLWLAVHRWLGLTAGLVFSLIGLTGSVLVFDHAIDEWLNPQLLLTDGTGTRLPLQQIIESAERYTGEPALSLSKPRIDNGVFEVWFQAGSEEDPKFAQVLVDPYSGEAKGRRVWGEYLMTYLYRLHFRLLGGEIGGVFVGLVGLLVIVSLLSGIYLWWPLWRNSLRAAFSIRRNKRNYDIHKTFGIVSSLLLIVLTFTGIYMEFPMVFRSILELASPMTDHPEGLVSTTNSNVAASAKSLTADEALAIASREFPDAKFDHLHPPEGNNGVYEVAFRQAGEVQQSYGRSQVFLDQYSGQIIEVRQPSDFTSSDAFAAWQFPLHNGEAFGLLGRWLVCVSGLLPTALFVTGVIMVQRRKSKPVKRSRENEKLAA